MKQFILMLGAACVIGASINVFAADTESMRPDDKKDGCMMMHFKMMDKNGDGMISNDEYMAAMKMHWEKMPKSKGDMVSMDDMKKGIMMEHEDCDKMMMNK